MPSRPEMESAVREACIKANPEIATEETITCGREWSAWSYGTMTADDFEVTIGRDPSLADVLMALLVLPTSTDYAFRCDGTLLSSENGWQFDQLPAHWNLALPLSGQSDGTVGYLYSLLKPE